jgi:hypothetical protein
MFRYSLLINDLLKALTHKYIRRVPKGVTKTGATKYVYYYAGQEGHGQGIAHDEELIAGASFAFGEHGKTRYHAHITKVDGDKVTVKYDDGAKKGTEETMTKKQFQSMIHGEHATGIKQAKEKAEKQLKDFQAGKAKGVKVKQETLDKLEQRVKNLDDLTTQDEEPTSQETQEEGLSISAQRTLDEWNKKKGKKTSTINSIPDMGDLAQVLYEQDKNAFADAVYKTPAFTKYRDEPLAMPALQGVLRDKIDKILGFKIGLLSNDDEQQFKEKILDALRTGKNLDQKDMAFLLDHKILNNLVDKKAMDTKIKQFHQSALENQVLSFIKQNREEYKDAVKEIDHIMNKITSFNPDYNETKDIFSPVSLKDLDDMKTHVDVARRLLVAYDQVWNKNNIEKNDLPNMGRTATALFLRNFEQLQDKNKILDKNDSSNILDKMYNAQIRQDSYELNDSDRLRIFLSRVQKAEEFLDKQKEVQENPEKVATQKKAVDDLFTNLQNTMPKTQKEIKNFVSNMKNVAKTLDNKESTVHFLQEFKNNMDQYIKAYDKAHTGASLRDYFNVRAGDKTPKNDLLNRLMKWEIREVVQNISFLDRPYGYFYDDKNFSDAIGDLLKEAQDKKDMVRKSLKFVGIANQLIKALRTR